MRLALLCRAGIDTGWLICQKRTEKLATIPEYGMDEAVDMPLQSLTPATMSKEQQLQ